MPEQEPSIRLVTRGDDAGSFRAANHAIAEVFDHGIVRNASIMVPTPHFEHAAELFRARPGLCVGLHVTINAEWDGPRWGPVSPVDQVRSLVDSDGHFLPTPMMLFERGVDLGEALLEVKAQLDRARRAGLVIRYMDEHMGVGWIHARGNDGTRLRALLRHLAQDEGIVWHEVARELPALPDAASDDGVKDDAARSSAQAPWKRLIKRLDRAAPGTYALISHPAHDDEEMRSVTLPGGQPGTIAEERAADRAMLIGVELKCALESRRVRCIRYDEV